MHVRIFGFSAALVFLAALGFVLVQADPYASPPAAEEEPTGPSPEEEAARAQEQAKTAEAEAIDEELEEEEEPSIDELRQQAEDAQRRVAEHLEAARRAQEEALRVQRRAGILPETEGEAALAGDPEELGRRIEELEARIAEFEAAQAQAEEEVEALDEDLAALEEHGEILERSRQARIAELDRGIASMTQLFETLTTGNADIEGALANLSRQLAGTSDEAARYAGEDEARWIGLAQNSVEAAREALNRRDLYAARVALGVALYQAQAAKRAAELAGPNPLVP